MTSTTTDHTVTTTNGTAAVTVSERGNGHPFLLLHGGAGPGSVEQLADVLASTRSAHVLTPTHPGFGGTPRPATLGSVRGLAALYLRLLEDLDLSDVTVIGNSLGGWVAAEMALLHSPRVSSVAVVDAVGLASDTDPIVDFFTLSSDQVVDLSYSPPRRDRARADLAALPDVARAAMQGNRDALLCYGGTAMSDPTLLERLPAISTPTLVVWGAHDRIVTTAHAHAYADAIPGARLEILDDAGHLPQLETPDHLADLVWAFATEHATGHPA